MSFTLQINSAYGTKNVGSEVFWQRVSLQIWFCSIFFNNDKQLIFFFRYFVFSGKTQKQFSELIVSKEKFLCFFFFLNSKQPPRQVKVHKGNYIVTWAEKKKKGSYELCPYFGYNACSKQGHKAIYCAAALPTSCQEIERLSRTSLCDILKPHPAQIQLGTERHAAWQEPAAQQRDEQ